MFRSRNVEISPNSAGIVPPSVLLPSDMFASLAKSPNSVGIPPVNSFDPKRSLVNSVRPTSSGGRAPFNCLLSSPSCVTPLEFSTDTPSQLVIAVATSQFNVAVPARLDSMSRRISQSRATLEWALASEAVGLVVAQP